MNFLKHSKSKLFPLLYYTNPPPSKKKKAHLRVIECESLVEHNCCKQRRHFSSSMNSPRLSEGQNKIEVSTNCVSITTKVNDMSLIKPQSPVLLPSYLPYSFSITNPSYRHSYPTSFLSLLYIITIQANTAQNKSLQEKY